MRKEGLQRSFRSLDIASTYYYFASPKNELPPDWILEWTDYGEYFYYNTSTGESSWYFPESSTSQTPTETIPSLPEGNPITFKDSESAQPLESPETQPLDNFEAQPSESSDAQPLENPEAQPLENPEAQPLENSEVQPLENSIELGSPLVESATFDTGDEDQSDSETPSTLNETFPIVEEIYKTEQLFVKDLEIIVKVKL